MRFGAVLILLLMLMAGFAVSEAWAHQGPHGNVAVSGHADHASAIVTADAEDRAGLHPHSQPHQGHQKASNCLTAVGCAGVSSVIEDGYSVPAPQRVALASLFATGDRPQSVELPVDDRPPRTS